MATAPDVIDTDYVIVGAGSSGCVTAARLTEDPATHVTLLEACKMGSDPMSVVDNTLNVHGLDALRVVDASIMPAVVSGNTNAAAIMIAEKAADLMRQDLRLAA